MKFKDIDNYMQMAINNAHEAYSMNEVPVGAIIVSEHGEILSEGHNLKETNKDATAHAEIIAIKKAAERIWSWRLLNCSIFVTLEPCPMCMSAILQARIKNVYWGAYDKKGGSISLGYNFSKDDRLNHKFNLYGGFRHYECSQLLSNFFRTKRKSHQN